MTNFYSELVDSLKLWRIIHLMGISQIRMRYARSRLGQFWLIITNFIFIYAIGLVWSQIWQNPIEEFLPHVMLGQIIFSFMSATISDSCNLLVVDSRIYKAEKRPMMISSFANVYRQIIYLLHNIPIIIVVLLWSDVAKVDMSVHWFGFLILGLIFLFSVSYTLSLVCARFRDLGQLVALVMQISFLLTPVMWMLDYLPVKYQKILLIFNPLAAFIEAIRSPLIGTAFPDFIVWSVSAWITFSVITMIIAHRNLRRNTIFWI